MCMERQQEATRDKRRTMRQGWMGGAIGLGFIAGVILLAMMNTQGGRAHGQIIPPDGSTPAVTAPIRMLFNREVTAEAVETLFSIEPSISGEITISGQHAIFWPDEPLESGIPYTVSMAPGLIDGRMFDGATSRFTPRQPQVLFGRRTGLVMTSLYRMEADGGETLVYENAKGIHSYSPARDGETIYLSVARGTARSVIIAIDRDGQSERVLVSCGELICTGLAASPDGRYLAYEKRPAQQGIGMGSQVLLFDLSSQSEIAEIAYETISGRAPTWGGRERLGFADTNSGTLRVFDLGTGEKYFAGSEMGEMGVFSPDGSQLVFPEIRVVGGTFFPGLLIATMVFDGKVESLLEDAQEDTAPAWSPDGRWIAFSRKQLDRQTGFFGQMALLDTGTGEVTLITYDPDRASTHFSWSPDSRQIAVGRYAISDTGSTPEIWLFDISDGSLTLAAEGGESPTWLP